MTIIRGALLAALAGMLVVGCSNKVDDNLIVNNVAPKGSVGGQVINGADDRPLAGVTVRVLTGDFIGLATTDGSGFFGIDGVPASGPVLVLMEKSGYVSAQINAVFTSAAGNFPVDNATLTLGPVGLLPASGQFVVWVYDEYGQPASGHQLSLMTSVRYLNFANGTGTDSGELGVSANVTANGMATFTDLPDFALLGGRANALVLITVPPYDADGDGHYEYSGGNWAFDLIALGTPQPVIVLTNNFPTTLGIESSNIQDLETVGACAGASCAPGVVAPTGPIHIVFNMPVYEAQVSVWNHDGTTSYPANVVTNGRSMIVQFPTALSTSGGSGAEFNLGIYAVGGVGDEQHVGYFEAPFFIHDANSQVAAELVKENPGDPLDRWFILTFDEPVGTGAAGLSLGGGNCVVYFDINNLGTGPLVGDDVGELGNANCGVTLTANEPLPAEPAGAGLSGYTRFWRFLMPDLAGPIPMPSNVPVHFMFNSIASPTNILRRVNGEPVPEIILQTL